MWIVKKVMNLNKGDVILEIEAGNEKIQGIIIAQTNCTLFTNETYKKTFFRSI